MKVGLPKEILDNEFRVALTPKGVRELVKAKHEVFVQTLAGLGSGISDDEYVKAGAKIVSSIEEVYKIADLILKVKQPLIEESQLLKEGQILFTYLHLASDKELALNLCKSKATCIAYETVQLDSGALPLLIPMSEIAGKMSVQIGARHLEKYFGGSGILLGGVNGVEPANVVIIGAGIVGFNACMIAVGMGANVYVLDNNLVKLKQLETQFGSKIKIVPSSPEKLEELLIDADLVICGIHVVGSKASKLITKNLMKKMKENIVIVDVSIDQGGCVEGGVHTSHSMPIVKVENVNVYAVPNIPGSVPYTSTRALTNVTLPYAIKLANSGLEACFTDSALNRGVNVHNGNITHKSVADALDLKFIEFKK